MTRCRKINDCSHVLVMSSRDEATFRAVEITGFKEHRVMSLRESRIYAKSGEQAARQPRTTFVKR